MQVLEILSLKKEKESIKKIDRFLANASKENIDYHQAICYKALILSELGKTNEALKLLMPAEEEFDSLSNDIVVCYTDTLKNIFMSIKQYDLALKYIEIKEAHLSFMAHDEFYKDMILYHKALDNTVEVKRYLSLYLNDDISDDNRVFAHELLIDYQYNDRNFNAFYDSYDYLYEHYLETRNEESLNKIDILKANMLIYESRDDEAIDFITTLSKRNLDDSTKLALGSSLIEIYTRKQEYRKAAITDANYSDLAKTSSYEASSRYYKALKDLYEKMNNRYGFDTAAKALEALEIEQSKVVVVPEVKKRETKKRIADPIVIEKVIKEEKKDEGITFKVVSNLIDISSLYNKIRPAIESLCNTSEDVSLRESLRVSLIEAEKALNFEEVIIILKGIRVFRGFHYKKARLYDKEFTDEMVIEKTLSYRAFETNRALAVKVMDDLYYNINPVTKNPLEFEGVIAIPLIFNGQVVGSISYYGAKSILENSNFELLSCFSSMLNLRIDYSLYQDHIIAKHSNLNYVVERAPFGIIENNNGEMIFNASAISIYKLADSKLELELFESLIIQEDRIKYHNLMFELLRGDKTEAIIEYSLVDLTKIKEHLYLKELSDHYEIISIVFNITDDEKKKKELMKLAYNDEFTPLPSLLELKNRLLVLNEDKKYSFTMINANKFKLYKDVYGLKFSLDLIKAIALSLNKIIPTYKGSCYHFDSDKFIIILPNNDERSVKKLVIEILDKLSRNLADINKRVSLTFNAGIVLVHSSTSKVDYDSMIEKASTTLDSIEPSDIKRNSALYFDSKTRDDNFYRFQMELHISEAIDNKTIKLGYQQIVNIKQKKLFGYEVSLNLADTLVDEELVLDIVRKRHLTEMIDKYLINRSIIELKDFYDTHGSYFKVFLHLHASTMASSSFLAFLEEKYKMYKIPRALFSIEILNDGEYDLSNVCKALRREKIMIGSSSLDSVLKYKLGIYFCDNQVLSMSELFNVKTLCDSMDIELILSSVNEPSEVKLYDVEGYSLIKGNAINKKYTIEEIIKLLK